MRLKSLLILPFLVASLQAASVGDLIFALSYDGTEYKVANCLDTASGPLEIPSTYNDLPVTSIGYRAFWSNNLTSVIIPDSVTAIESYAFDACTVLTSVTIGNSVTSIGSEVFRSCPSDLSVTLNSAGVDLSVASSNFYDKVKYINISEGTTTISNYAFYYCRDVTSITIPDSVTLIGDFAFFGCTGLTNITIPDSVTSIGDYAFRSCSSLTSIIIPDSVELLGNNAFNNCIRITSLVIGDALRVVQDYTFNNCTSLSDVSFGQNVNIISNSAFSGCSSLSELTFNDYLYQIDSYAFQNCTQLRKVTFGEYLRYLPSDAFDGCFLLVEANFKGSPPVVDTNPFQYSPTTVYADSDASGWSANYSYRPVFRKDMSSVDPYPTDVYVTEDISENTTWASDITYFLDGVISVVPGVALNIEPGTVVRGLHSGETTNGDLSILFVLPGAKLVAKGTEENPIIFTNTDDTLVDINPYNPGDRDQYESNETSAEKSTDDQNLKRWGGIYILGNAFVDEIGTHPYYYLDPNFPGDYLRQDGPLERMGLIKEIISLLGESPYPLERIYDTNDDSGDLEFISIRYTGDTKVYSPDRGDRNLVMQPNGLTLYGVGNGTDISNIEVFNTGDDAFRFHGGSVQPSKLAGIIFGDECFEFDYGWSGQINKIFGYGTEYSSKFLEVESYPNGSPTMNHSTTTVSFASYINNYISARSIGIRDGGILDLLNSYISSSFTGTFYRLYNDGLSVSGETNAYLTSYPTMEGLPNTFTNAYINDFEKTKSLRATHGAFANADIWTQWMIGHKFLINNCSEYVALSMPQDSDLGDSDLDGIPDVDDLHTGFNDRNFEFYIQNNAPSNYKTLEEFNTVVAERDAKLTLNEVADLRTGSAMIEVSNNQATIQIQMEESSNLESWTEIGDAATMVVPADSDTKFFRFKMTE